MAQIRGADHHEGPLGPLAGRRVATTVTERDAALRDHLVHSVPVLPGVFLLDLVLRLVRRAGADPAAVELRRVVFRAPVVGTEGGRRVEVATGEPGPDGGLPVTVRSRPAGSTDGTWEVNCRAEIHPHTPGGYTTPFDPARLGEAAKRSVDVEDLYGFVRRLDIHHTGLMKAAGTVRVGDDYALAHMRLAPEAEPYLGHFHAHPAVLDFATLVPMLLFGPDQRDGARHAFIPIYIESFHAPGGLAAENLVYVPGPVGGQLDAELFTADLEIRTLDGTPAARLTGFRAKRIRSAELITGLVDRIEGSPSGRAAAAPVEKAPVEENVPEAPPSGLLPLIQALMAEKLDGSAGDTDPDLGFYDLGLTSVDLLGIAATLEERLGRQLYPTLLFEYPTARALADHLGAEGLEASAPAPAVTAPPSTPRPAGAAGKNESPLAIVGLAGRYPGAADPDELWDVLRDAEDRVTEIPGDRWDHTPYWDPNPGVPGRTRSKWGAFCDGIAEFDASLFHVPARQAAVMDPHERLFLQTAWAVLEDAGHTPESLKEQTGGAVGVFAGAMWNDYQLHGLDRLRDGEGRGDADGGDRIAGSWSSALANRVSYTFDFQGPSLTVDTACSASLTALHLAAESIRRGECRAAVVGGVNLSLHPYKYLRLSELGMLSTDGRCRPFGKDADGYVPGEGVGAVLVRPLADALASGDHVYAVVRGSALRHSGRTGGYGVPGPEAQTRVVTAALADAGVPVETIGCLEAHASGTTLGDRIEIEALTRAFRQHTDARGFCAIGSVKSSIGHLEAAAGIASLTKLLLCMRHRAIPAMRDTGGTDPAIRFEETPFRLPRETEPWPAPVDPSTGAAAPRRAALSAFGAGGANVHVVVEEYEQATVSLSPRACAVPLSARTEEQLRAQAERLARHLRRAVPVPDLTDVAHTLRSGRRAMAHRLAVVAADCGELAEALEDFAAGRPSRLPLYTGHAPHATATGPSGPRPVASEELLAEDWSSGRLSSWPGLPGACRVSLPAYPFARERHWIGAAREGTREAGEHDRTHQGGTRLYAPRWQPRPLPRVAPEPGPEAVVVAFDTDDARVAALRALCRRVIQVRPGASYTRLSQDTWEISPTAGEHYERLVLTLREEGADPDAVLHLWHLRPSGAVPVADTTGPLSVFLLCKAWAVGRRGPLPVLFGYRAEEETPPLAAVGGLARSIRLEQPKLALKTVRYADGLPTVAELLAEAGADVTGVADTEVRRTASGRGALGFVPLPAAPDTPTTLLARDGGAYLITGGAGGLGRHTARHLASRGRVSVALVGRSAPGPRTDAIVAELEAAGARALYLPADVTDHDALERAVAEVRRRYGPLTGVIHAAGVTDDALLVNKTAPGIERVLAPKMTGAAALDLVTRADPLDYLLLYSSVASVLGSAGAADYSAANRCLDSFAAWREERRLRGERQGRTLAVNWPLWRDGGMRIEAAMEDLVLARTGAVPLETADGLFVLETALAHRESQVVVLNGDLARLEAALGIATDTAGPRTTPHEQEDLLERTTEYVTRLVRGTLNGSGPAPDDDGVRHQGFMAMGMSSAHVVELTRRLSRDLAADIPPTVPFRHSDVDALSTYLLREHRTAVSERLPGPPPEPSAPAVSLALALAPVPVPSSVGRATVCAHDEAIAVIGMAGRLPGSGDLAGFWDSLITGRDLVSPVPRDRWDHSRHHDPTGRRPGGTDCGHGAFLDDVARFDARFFGVTRAEAEGMDPQARLLLEVLYEAAEDAGAAAGLRGSATGTFVGQCFQDYHDEMTARGREFEAHEVTGTSVSMAANRASYAFDLTGPSLVVDTACSSSLYALHLAVNALRRGECDMAFAAGSNLILSPQHYLRSSAIGALSPSGRCHTFDARADGYVPGEAVVAVLLKPLARALADGDPVQAVIRAVAVNHGGRASAVTAPHPGRQTRLLRKVWQEAGIDPRTLGYLEAHGTGTGLGDPIEIEAAVAALREHTEDNGFCAVGSAKAHLGHTEGAAGLVGLVKTVLSMRHRIVPAMPGFERANPLCDFDGPLFLNSAPMTWETTSGTPRRAGVSSFGFGGAYAHAVVEEPPAVTAPGPVAGPLLFPFSAMDDDRLRAVVRRHRAYLARHPDIRLDRVSATLCRGRESLPRRVAVVAATLPDLLRQLDVFLAGASGGTCLHGPDGAAAEDALVAVAHDWAAGRTGALPASGPGLPRLSLPTYPFAGDRYWFEDLPAVTGPQQEEEPVSDAVTEADAGGTVAEVMRFIDGSGFSGRRVRTAMDRLDDLLRRWCRHLLSTGPADPAPTAARLRERLADEERYGRLADALTHVVARVREGAGHTWGTPEEARRLMAETTSLAAEYPELTPWTDLVAACVPHLPALLDGTRDALEVYFSDDHPDLLLKIYDGNPVADHHNEIVARAVAARSRAVRAREPGRTVRVLEIGGGTGGTTRRVLELLAEGDGGDGVHYTFTDVSPAFLPTARARFSEAVSRFDTRVLDLDAEPEEQGFEPACADIVIAANSVHATRFMAGSLARIRRLLAPGGVLVLEELVRNRDCMTVMIGALPGYWSATDPHARLEHSPFLDVPRWREALTAQGFVRTWALGSPDLDETEFDNAVLIGEVPAAGAAPAGPAGRESAGTASPPARPTPADQTPPAVPGDVREQLREVFARFFGLAPDEIDTRAPFDSLGMDSLSAIQLVRRLEPDFGKLPKVLLYEHPTIEALAGYLATRPRELPEPLPPAGSGSHPETEAPVRPVAQAPAGQRRGEDPIAIVGMAGRYAKSPDLTTWWRHLSEGTDLVTEIPADRFDWREIFGDPRRELGKVNSRWGSFCDGIDLFDAAFFGMTPLEAELMDPQQRLMLQTAWKAVEDSGHRPGELRGSRTGVFIGATSHDYDWQLQRAGRHREGHVVSGNGHCLIANRISHQLDLRGPSEAVDTACSSSLTALHRAVRSVATGECDQAIAGGVHLVLTADLFVALGQLGIMSPAGRCAAFDRKADGMVRGEGAVAVLLKPLSAALADGDTVYALVRGSGVSHGGGGHMNSLMMPNPSAQAELITSVYRTAGVDPRTVTYIEAHGTGTEVGDPIELRGLRKAFAELTGLPETYHVTPWCGIGTVKSNVGHTEAAAGLTGVVKTVLALRHGELPPTLHFTEPNPLLEIEGSPFRVIDRRTPWPSSPGAPRRAGVSSFGLGGTNAHVLLEEYPAPDHHDEPAVGPARPLVVPLSARTPERLREYARQMCAYLDGTPDVALEDLTHTLTAGRDEMPHRLAVVAGSTRELGRLLRGHLEGAPSHGVLTGEAGAHAPAEREAGPSGAGDPHAVARRWADGGPLWQSPAPGRAPRRISAPTYPFEPARHWAGPRTPTGPTAPAEPPVPPASAGETGGLRDTLRALSEGRISVDEADKLMEGVS